MGFGFSVQDIPAVNTVRTILQKVTDQKFDILFRGLLLLFFGGSVGPDGFAFVFCTEQLVNIRGLSLTCIEVRSLLWCAMTRMPFLKFKAWHMDKSAFQLSH